MVRQYVLKFIHLCRCASESLQITPSARTSPSSFDHGSPPIHICKRRRPIIHEEHDLEGEYDSDDPLPPSQCRHTLHSHSRNTAEEYRYESHPRMYTEYEELTDDDDMDDTVERNVEGLAEAIVAQDEEARAQELVSPHFRLNEL